MSIAQSETGAFGFKAPVQECMKAALKQRVFAIYLIFTIFAVPEAAPWFALIK